MRARRWLAAGTILGVVLGTPWTAGANGGAYIELDRTHYLPGETAVATAYVSIPERKQDLLDRGPFYAFVLPYEATLQPGRPIPDDAIRVGSFTVDAEKRDTFELRASFVVPDVPGNYYRVALCDDPCTVTGFAEPLSGDISIVETAREAELLNQSSELAGRLFGLRRQVRKAARQLEELQTQLEVTAGERSEYQARVEELEAELDVAATRAAAERGPSRPIVDGWGVAAAALALLALGALMILRRRRPDAIAVPDTIEELERHAEERPARR